MQKKYQSSNLVNIAIHVNWQVKFVSVAKFLNLKNIHIVNYVETPKAMMGFVKFVIIIDIFTIIQVCVQLVISLLQNIKLLNNSC